MGNANRKKLHNLVDDDSTRCTLELQLAALIDMRVLEKTTHEMEGDRLKLLLVYACIERMRALGLQFRQGGDGVLPNVDATLRSQVKLKNGVKMYVRVIMRQCIVVSSDQITPLPLQMFRNIGLCKGKITSTRNVASKLYLGEERKANTVTYEMARIRGGRD
ncbi:MAG: hypothetical protein SGPRY_008577 [Prymnesium sp.]